MSQPKAKASECEFSALWAAWDSHLQSLSVPAAVITVWKTNVTRQYSEKQRHYHTLRHIVHMFTLMRDFNAQLRCNLTVFLAIIFHDIIYDPKASDNEEQSAEMFRQFARDARLKGEIEEQICDMILKTKSHKADAHTTPGLFGSADCDYFLDFDMAILGAQHPDYTTYAEHIRLEYSHIPLNIYRVKRCEVLRDFLETPNLFATPELRASFEQQARANVAGEIARLESAKEQS